MLLPRSIHTCNTNLHRIIHLLFIQSKSHHSITPLNPSPKPDLLNLHNHKDWLSPTESIKILQTLKDPNSTLYVLNQLSIRKDYKPNEALYTSVINNLQKAKNFDAIEQVMTRIKNEKACRLSESFFHNVIKIYGLSAGRINRVIETLFDMPSYGCWPTVKTFNFVMNLLVNTKNFDVIHEVYLSATRLGVEIDVCCLNIMIKGLCKNGDVDAALKVFDEMPKQRCVPNVRTYSVLMHGLCGNGRVDEAFSLLGRMEAEGIEPDAILMNVLISGLRKNGRVDKSVEVFNMMLLKGCEPVCSSYQEVLYALIDRRKYNEAMKLARKMSLKKMVVSFNSYKSLIRGLCEENRVGDIDLVLKQMVDDGFVPKAAMWKQMLQCVLYEKTNVGKLALEIKTSHLHIQET